MGTTAAQNNCAKQIIILERKTTLRTGLDMTEKNTLVIRPRLPCSKCGEPAHERLYASCWACHAEMLNPVMEIKDRAKRKPGRPKGTGTGKVAVTRSVSMPEPVWDRLDEIRKPLSRGEWIMSRLPKSNDRTLATQPAQKDSDSK